MFKLIVRTFVWTLVAAASIFVLDPVPAIVTTTVSIIAIINGLIKYKRHKHTQEVTDQIIKNCDRYSEDITDLKFKLYHNSQLSHK